MKDIAPSPAAALNHTAVHCALIVRQGDRQLVAWNPAAEGLLGWQAPEALGCTLSDLDLRPLDEIGDEALANGVGTQIDREMLLRCADGHYVAVLARASSSPTDPSGGVAYVLWDQSHLLFERRPAEPDPLELLQYAAEVVALISPEGVISFVSSPVLREAGYAADDLIGVSLLDLVHPDEADRVRDSLHALVDHERSPRPLSFRLRKPTGDYLWLEGRAINLLRRSSLQSLLVTLHDVTRRVERESGLAHRATHDALTDLPNRVLFMDRLNHVVEHARRHDQLIAVFFWDLDQFKLVNDTAGHAVGDSLLEEVARRAVAVMRAEDTVARLGGDEFVACAAVSNVAQVVALARRLLSALAIELTLSRGERLTVTASLGVAYGRSVDPERLVVAADRAMYDAKRRARGHELSIVNVGSDLEPSAPAADVAPPMRRDQQR